MVEILMEQYYFFTFTLFVMYCASPHPLLTKTIANKRQIIVRTFIAAIS